MYWQLLSNMSNMFIGTDMQQTCSVHGGGIGLAVTTSCAYDQNQGQAAGELRNGNRR